jgi:hypothetical protein
MAYAGSSFFDQLPIPKPLFHADRYPNGHVVTYDGLDKPLTLRSVIHTGVSCAAAGVTLAILVRRFLTSLRSLSTLAAHLDLRTRSIPRGLREAQKRRAQ